MKRCLETYMENIVFGGDKAPQLNAANRYYPDDNFRVSFGFVSTKERKEIRRNNKGFILGFVKPAADKKWYQGGSFQTLFSLVSGLDRYLTLFDSFLFALVPRSQTTVLSRLGEKESRETTRPL